ncbi:MAG: DNA mismatch repair protein MutS [Anaerolineales bacterium]|nr:DNA mismatch repair protein MutS [Anaerolineales bacterium]
MVKQNIDEVSPIRRQYLEIKEDYQNTILFFRLGDFYETFDEDAELVSKTLDIVLTGRNVGKGTRVPMAGIPYHAMENYLSRLIEKGLHVAICEQIGDEPVKGLMPRSVVRIVTPGTIIEPGLLPGDSNNYLAGVILEGDRAGVAYVDITTGEFSATEFIDRDVSNLLRSELIRLRPAEILYPDDMVFSENSLPGFITRWPAWRFETGRCEEKIKSHFNVSSLNGFGLKSLNLATRAAGAILQYLQSTQPNALKLLIGIHTYSTQEFMTLDGNTRRNLELTETIRHGTVKGSLLGVLDHTVSPMGRRTLNQWVGKPLLDVQQIQSRQEKVSYFFNNGLTRAEIRSALKPLNDLERLTNRVLGGSAQPRDLLSIKETLDQIPVILSLIPQVATLASLKEKIDPCVLAYQLLTDAISDDSPATLQNTGIIRPGYSIELDEILSSSQHARDWISTLEPEERKRTGIKTLKVGYNKVHGYYIEVTHTNTEMVPQDYIRKQTLVNAERYITPELKEYESKVLNAEENIHEIELRLFKDICQKLTTQSQKILETARTLAKLDVISTLAEVAALEGFICPEVVEEDVLVIENGRHPVVEKTLTRGYRFVPNETNFEDGERIRIITGPNMSGKSTYLRQVALIVLLAQMGSYVPASKATIGLVDRIFTRIGAQDEIHAGQSTFMVEMVETANILHHATNRSLLVLDEIGRGTSTYDGLSIAWAVIEYLHNHPGLRSKTLFATHYHELTSLADLLPGVRNYNVAVSEIDGKVVFLHKIVPGGADRSYGIHVGQLAGLPGPVIQRAGEILDQLEKSSGTAVKIDASQPKQIRLFPETNPLLDELKEIDINSISPLEALNRLFEWKKRYSEDNQ